MKTFDNLIEAIAFLRSHGYTEDFNLKPDCIHCVSYTLELHPEDFFINQFYRFEGMTNPDDSSVVYAFESKDGLKGILIDAYGVYAEKLTSEMSQKLQVLNN